MSNEYSSESKRLDSHNPYRVESYFYLIAASILFSGGIALLFMSRGNLASRQSIRVLREGMQRTPIRKVRVVGFVAVAGLLLTAVAQSREVPKLPPGEMQAVYKAAGLTERGGKILDACDQPVKPQVDVVDLNGDGQLEVFVQVNSSCYGMAGGQLSLLIKDKQGRWQPNLGVPAGGYKLLSTKNKGYPDIEIGGPGMCFPVWRWNGRAYAIHKRCDR